MCSTAKAFVPYQHGNDWKQTRAKWDNLSTNQWTELCLASYFRYFTTVNSTKKKKGSIFAPRHTWKMAIQKLPCLTKMNHNDWWKWLCGIAKCLVGATFFFWVAMARMHMTQMGESPSGIHRNTFCVEYVLCPVSPQWSNTWPGSQAPFVLMLNLTNSPSIGNLSIF